MKMIGPSQIFYSYVMNNYWHTNYKSDQEGLVSFRYSLQPHEKYRAEDAVRFGIEQRQPLIVAPASTASKPAPPLLQLQPPSVIATSIRPSEDGRAWLLHLYNPTGQSQAATLHWNKTKPVRFFLSNGFEQRLDQISDEFTVAAFGSRIIRIEQQN
jgi:alpha-mannosidase